MTTQRYRGRGVSPQKEDVHAAVADTDAGLFPTAFCHLVPDHLGGDPDFCLAMHADGAGTKSALAYLHYRETGEPSVFRGIAQDAVVMNLDDLLCVGALGPFLLSNTIGRNARLVPAEVLRELLAGFAGQVRTFAAWGIELTPTGGETADVGDLVRTLIVDATVAVRIARNEVIANDRVRPGDLIFGLASDGQATYETEYNSGIGSNGLTSARHDLLAAEYGGRYPETVEPGMPAELRYGGPHHLDDPLAGTPLTVGQALLSPTRSYAPFIRDLLTAHRDKISALIHCTGGGQTKALRVGRGIHYVKDALFDPPPLFEAVRQASGASWRELYQVFNMGHRMEVVGPPELGPIIEELGARYQIAARRVGHCQASPDPASNQVTLHTPGGVESYQQQL